MKWSVFLLAGAALVSAGCSDDEKGDKNANMGGAAGGLTGPNAGGFNNTTGGTLTGDDFTRNDTFEHHVEPVDVLFVIDNSCSMIEEQEALSVSFPGFMQLIQSIGDDYHIGVVSTDMDAPDQSGRLREFDEDEDPGTPNIRWIEADTPEPYYVFESMAVMGTEGSADEKGRLAAYDALETLGDTDNAGFYREDASLATVIMSDEKDNTLTDEISIADFGNWYMGLKAEDAPEGKLSFNSIVGPMGGCATAGAGEGYLELTSAIGGATSSICDGNFGLVLAEVVSRLPTRFHALSEEPEAGTLTVSANEPDGGVKLLREEDHEFTYFEDLIGFEVNTALPQGTELVANYLPASLVLDEDETPTQ
jgi:hypothetical protein